VAALAAGTEAVSQAFGAGNITGSRVNLVGHAAGGTFVGDAPGSMFIGAQYVELSRERKAPVRQFSCRDGLRVSEEDEKASREAFSGSDAEVERLLEHLEERRVLVLAAERGAGKLSAAIYLGMQLRRQRGCGNGTVLADSLDRRVHVDIRHLAERDTEIAGRLLVFRKPFGRADPELARAFQKTDKAGWEQLAGRLRQQDAYLVFTADPEDVAAFRERPAVRDLVQPLLPHPAESLERALRDRLAGLEGTEAAEGLRGKDEQLLAAFHFTSSLAEFIDFYADQYQPGLRLDEAVARYHDTSEWLLQELEHDFEFWSFGFTLALAQCLPGARGVAWLDFDRLHRRIRQWLRRDLNQRSASAEGDEVWELEARPPSACGR
jgi:hypothetical protein